MRLLVARASCDRASRARARTHLLYKLVTCLFIGELFVLYGFLLVLVVEVAYSGIERFGAF